MTAISWPLAFLSPWPAVTPLPLLAFGAGVASLGPVASWRSWLPARSQKRRSQVFAACGLALTVCGATLAPLVIGVGSDILQARGYSEAHVLHWSVFASTASVFAVGVWMVQRASRSCAEDANQIITEFLGSIVHVEPS